MFTDSNELLEVEEKLAKKSKVTLVASAIAVASVLVIAVTISLQGNKQLKTDVAVVKESTVLQVTTQASLPTIGKETHPPSVAKSEVYVPPSASDSASLLARDSNMRQLEESISSSSSAVVYGFSGDTTPDKVSFRLGVHATDLELLLRGNDRDGATAQLKQMVELLRQADKGRGEVKRLTEVLGRMEAGEALQGFAGCTAGLESVIATAADCFLYRFGVWAEGGRLAAIAGNSDYVTAQSLRYVKEGVKGMQLPTGVGNALGEIEAVVGRGEFSEKDFVGMRRAFEDVVGVF